MCCRWNAALIVYLRVTSQLMYYMARYAETSIVCAASVHLAIRRPPRRVPDNSAEGTMTQWRSVDHGMHAVSDIRVPGAGTHVIGPRAMHIVSLPPHADRNRACSFMTRSTRKGYAGRRRRSSLAARGLNGALAEPVVARPRRSISGTPLGPRVAMRPQRRGCAQKDREPTVG